MLFAPVISVAALWCGGAWAQSVTVDGRLSPAQTLAGPNYAIGAGLGRQVGGNLFHSFGAFGLKQGETATFSGPSSVGNVVGRVTGGVQSSINGGIRSTIPGTNLYLVNPAGVVFGPNASVNVGGSFHASSADYVRMQDGARFQATNPDASTLSAAPPEAFGFLSAAPQPIMVNGSALQVKPGYALGLVGGDVTISNGFLRAQGGTVNIASAAGPGELPVDPRAGSLPTVARSGRVQVTNDTAIRSTGTGGRSGGSVFIHAGNLSVSASDIEADNGGSGSGGLISLHGDRVVSLRNGTTVRALAGGTGRGQDVSISTATGGKVRLNGATVSTTASAGDGGAIAISTGALRMRNGAAVLSGAGDRGNGGPINVAADSVRLGGTGTTIASHTTGVGLVGANGASIPAGAGGKISLTGKTVAVQNNALIGADTSGSGAGGAISITAAQDITIGNGGEVGAGAFGSGSGGSISIAAAHDITMHGGSILSNAAVGSVVTGNAGDVTIAARGALTLGQNSYIATNSNNGSNAATIRVTAGEMTVADDSHVRGIANSTGRGADIVINVDGKASVVGTGSNGSSDISGSSESTGNAGDITVNAGALILSRGGRIGSDATSSGSAGTVRVNAASTSIENGFVSSDTQGTGQGGDVTVNTGALTISRGGGVSSITFASGNAGRVTLNVEGALTIDAAKAGSSVNGVTSEAVAGSSGSAGTVKVNAGSISLINGGFINSSAGGTGRGGSVTLTTPGALLLNGRGEAGGPAEVSTSATGPQSGTAGTVTINAGSVSVLNSGVITSNTRGTGAGGSVLVTTPGPLLLNGGDGTTIAASASGPQSGDAGTISVSAGTVAIQNGARISGSTSGPGRGGNVTVSTGALLLDGGSTATTGIFAQTTGLQSGDAGTVAVKASTATVQNGAQIAGGTFGSGRGGSVSVNAGALTLVSGSGVLSTTQGSGNAGQITLAIGGPLTIVGAGGGNVVGGVSSAAQPGSSGSAGAVTVNAGSVSIINGGFIASTASGTGAGGSVLVTTLGALVLDGQGVASSSISAASLGPQSGNAGSVTVNAGSVAVQNGAQITSSTSSPGRGGDVLVSADALTLASGGSVNSATSASGNAGQVALAIGGPLTIDGAGSGSSSSSVSSAALPRSSGSAGTVKVNAGNVSVLNGGLVTSSTSGTGAGGPVLVTTPGALVLDGAGSQVGASALGPQSGDAGTVTVKAGSVLVQGGAQVTSSTSGPGRGGDVSVSAGSDIRLNGAGPQVNATSTGTGDAGSVTVSAPRVTLRDGASISTGAGAANGGNITIGSGDLLYLQRSSITTSVNGALGNGGNIAVDTRFVVLDRSVIQADAVGGNGGNVQVRADQLVQSAGSAVTASSQRGVSGEIFIAAQLLNLNGSLVVLASDLRSAAALLREGCAARGARPRSSLIAAGRGGQRQGLQATLPALYFAGRPMRGSDAAPAQAVPDGPARVSLNLSSQCG